MAKSNSVRVEKSFSDITLDNIRVGQFQKANTKTAVLRQLVTITSHYPESHVSNDMADSLVDPREFHFAETSRERFENRVAFVPVPEHYTRAQVEAAVAKANASGAKLYRVLSYQPILSEDDRRYLDRQDAAGQAQFMERRAARQALRYPQGHEQAGQLILDSMGRIQYRDTYLSVEGREDVDGRDPNSCWAPQSLIAEARKQLGNAGQAADSQANGGSTPAAGAADDYSF